MSSLPFSNIVGPVSPPSPSLILRLLGFSTLQPQSEYGGNTRIAIAQQLVIINTKCQAEAGNKMDDKSFEQQQEKYL
jgi:hypothetical protein